MISDAALAAALARQLLTPDQVAGLRALEAEVGGAAQQPADDEAARFVSGFADIFVALGLLLFLWALGLFMDLGAGAPLSAAGLAAASWLLAEFFTRRRRMALPSILLLIVFVLSSFLGAFEVAAVAIPGGPAMPALGAWLMEGARALPAAIAAAFATLMAAMHYVRFRVPITVAAGAGLVALLVVALALVVVPHLPILGFDAVLMGCGLAIFALAMRFDMSDRERLTRRSDIAFWLHLLAAPLIVHPLLSGLYHEDGLAPGLGGAAAVLVLFIGLALVAIVIDRRALLVSGLTYAGVAFSALIRAFDLAPASRLMPLVLLILGAFILGVSAGWQTLRRALLKKLPGRFARRLPHPLTSTGP